MKLGLRRRSFLFSGIAVTTLLVSAQQLLLAQSSTPQNTAPSNPGTSDLPQPAQAYSVASIRPSYGGFSQLHVATGSLTASNIPLRTLIRIAYELPPSQIKGGPSWLDTTGFDIEAKTDDAIKVNTENLTDAQRAVYAAGLMVPLQHLLAERFHLQLHTEDKDGPIYALVVAKGGPKMKPSTPQSNLKDLGYPNLKGNSGAGVRGLGPGRFVAIKATMSNLAHSLSVSQPNQELGRPVIDRTRLTTTYDFTLEWTPYMPPANAPGAPPSTDGPSIFSAVQEQLGLRLESTAGPVKTLIIDHVEMPTEN